MSSPGPTDYQASLLDGLLDGPSDGAPTDALGPLAGLVRRRLGDGAWIDHLPGWVSGADAVFERLVHEVPWHAEQRTMYDGVVTVPRLLCHYGAGAALPDPVLGEARERLGAHYADELGEPFATAGFCYYRDGRDSVAWHGDNGGRARTEDTMVAIVSFGSPRRLSLRPVGGRTTASYALGHGDLVVMGGSAQRTWEHAIHKTARPTGPRISVQLRTRGVH